MGTLKTCVEGDDNLEGAAGKVAVHVGVDYKLKSGTNVADCKSGYTGSATGAKEVACEGGVKLEYDVDDDLLDVIVTAPDVLAGAQGERTLAHEIAHILGPPHVGNTESDNLLHPTSEGNNPGSKRKLEPDQVAEIYKKACEFLGGQ